MYVCMCINQRTYTYTHTYAYSYTYTYIYIYTHTHTTFACTWLHTSGKKTIFIELKKKQRISTRNNKCNIVSNVPKKQM